MSKELLTKLNSTDSYGSLRIFIRELLSLDAPELKGVASVDYKNIRDIRNTLPSYCKPSVIKAKLTKTPIYSMLHSKMMLSGSRSIKHISQRTRKLMYMRNM